MAILRKGTEGKVRKRVNMNQKCWNCGATPGLLIMDPRVPSQRICSECGNNEWVEGTTRA